MHLKLLYARRKNLFFTKNVIKRSIIAKHEFIFILLFSRLGRWKVRKLGYLFTSSSLRHNYSRFTSSDHIKIAKQVHTCTLRVLVQFEVKILGVKNILNFLQPTEQKSQTKNTKTHLSQQLQMQRSRYIFFNYVNQNPRSGYMSWLLVWRQRLMCLTKKADT